MKLTYKTVKFTAKCNNKTIKGTYTPTGKDNEFYIFLSDVSKKLTGSKEACFLKEKEFDWGTTIFAYAYLNENDNIDNVKDFVIFMR